MTEHVKEFGDLRIGCIVTLRDWRGDTVKGEAFLSGMHGWLAKMSSGTGHVFPITPRELIAVKNGAAEMFARLQEGATVKFSDWNADTITGIAHHTPGGIWECKDAAGARWLLEGYRIISIEKV